MRVMTRQAVLARGLVNARQRELRFVMAGEAELAPLLANQSLLIGRVRLMALRAGSGGDGIVNVRRLECRFFSPMAFITELRLILLENESADDAVSFVAALAPFVILEWRMD